MYIISTFEHSTLLEIAITDLEEKGITKKDIIVIPLQMIDEQSHIFDSIHRADGISLFDGAAALGTAFMVLGSIYGFIWEWGPIIWGLIGLAIGATLGFLLDLLISKRKIPPLSNSSKIKSEVVIIVNCKQHQLPLVEKVLSDHQALGIGTYKTNVNPGV